MRARNDIEYAQLLPIDWEEITEVPGASLILEAEGLHGPLEVGWPKQGDGTVRITVEMDGASKVRCVPIEVDSVRIGMGFAKALVPRTPGSVGGLLKAIEEMYYELLSESVDRAMEAAL